MTTWKHYFQKKIVTRTSSVARLPTELSIQWSINTGADDPLPVLEREERRLTQVGTPFTVLGRVGGGNEMANKYSSCMKTIF